MRMYTVYQVAVDLWQTCMSHISGDWHPWWQGFRVLVCYQRDAMTVVVETTKYVNNNIHVGGCRYNQVGTM